MRTTSISDTLASLALSTLLVSSSVFAVPINVDTGTAGVHSHQFIAANPENVVNGTEATGGLAGATGVFNFGIHSALDMICYNITLHNFQGEFSSPANTATHIHEAALGASGPPRIAFPNPEPVNGDLAIRNSVGCLKGPFLTGVLVEGVDSGEGFHVDKIEANPSAFMADTHSSLALAGAVRGQLS
ncbi:uncharacterized protein RSE6_04746 [Rhynchosporium secalis]|uniref:CHRD domain-containing protein n=1 Tax=Rhynchosporium secalis TaxID=38038 RepID=A0A1E1M626_RHYSE|nr:uncharacterized protein RSE6_04746 [Rhynchosporium secalis]